RRPGAPAAPGGGHFRGSEARGGSCRDGGIVVSLVSRTRLLKLDRVLDEKIDWRYKSFPAGRPTPIRSVRERGWNVLAGEFLMPVMVLKDAALRHNSKLMARFCKEHDILIAPHGKTPMSPQLLQMQLDDGAWAVTAATNSQVRVWR